MPPKKRNKAYTKKRKGKSKGVPRAPAASASAPAAENYGVASTAATTTPAVGGTKATKATTRAFESVGIISYGPDSFSSLFSTKCTWDKSVLTVSRLNF